MCFKERIYNDDRIPARAHMCKRSSNYRLSQAYTEADIIVPDIKPDSKGASG